MYSTYHLASAEEVNADLLDAIKAAYKSKPITITVEEDLEEGHVLTQEQRRIINERLLEDDSEFISSDESIKRLNVKYGI